MISVAAHRIKQYGVEFYQASFSAREIDQLVKFEVLGYGGLPDDKSKKRARPHPGELGDPREPDRRDLGRLPAPGHPPQDRGAGRLLPRLPGGGQAPRHPRGRDHHLRQAARVPRGAPPPRPRVRSRSPRSRASSASWTASTGSSPSTRSRPRGPPGPRRARRPLRLARRPADRGALRHDQREAHAA